MPFGRQLLRSARRLLVRVLEPDPERPAPADAAQPAPGGAALPFFGVFPVGASAGGGTLDDLRVDTSGRISLRGWAAEVPELRLVAGGVEVSRAHGYRLRRPDVATHLGSTDLYAGYCVEFFLPPGELEGLVVLEGAREVFRLPRKARASAPHYGNLFEEKRVLHRDDIYGYGPPMLEADPGILELARGLPGPLLDLGCGSGALVRALRAADVEAFGLEIRRPAIERALRDDIRPFITLYDGGTPLPYATSQFKSLVCIEVLEHIPAYQDVLPEMARVAERALITVPDMSAIPALYPQHVVPWHLLESTHVNFFTQASLARTLRPHFPRLSFARTGEFEVNGTHVYTSLVAHCSKG
jgi:SAM-dependent methyltransferase